MDAIRNVIDNIGLIFSILALVIVGLAIIASLLYGNSVRVRNTQRIGRDTMLRRRTEVRRREGGRDRNSAIGTIGAVGSGPVRARGWPEERGGGSIGAVGGAGNVDSTITAKAGKTRKIDLSDNKTNGSRIGGGRSQAGGS